MSRSSPPVVHPFGNVSVRALAAEPLLLVCPPGHHLAQRKVVTPDALRDETFVEFSPGWGIRLAVDRLFAAERIERSISVEVPDVSTFSALVRAGLGIGFLTGSILGHTDELVGIKVRPAASFEIDLAVPSVGPLSLCGSGTRSHTDFALRRCLRPCRLLSPLFGAALDRP
jgi:DNA-binding transcriptional LysR family regulator